MALINISIVSDSVCPFCLLGLRKLQAAIKLFQQSSPSTQFALKFEPFLLDPTLPTDHGVNKRERYIKRFGGAEKVAAMEESMKARGKEYGINFSYDGNVRQTTDSHRMLWKAYEKGGEKQQLALVDRLFSGYFEHAQDPAEPSWLAQQAAQAGVGSEEEMLAFLKSDEGKSEVAKGISNAQQLGINGVPFFILHKEGEGSKRFGISGAQEPQTFQPVFEKLSA